MAMVFCRGCGKEIHDSAPMCPHCGAPQTATSIAADTSLDSTPWMAIASKVLGIICFLALIGDDSGWDANKISALGLLSLIGLASGIISLNTTKAGKKMAITGIVLTCITGLAALGGAVNQIV